MAVFLGSCFLTLLVQLLNIWQGVCPAMVQHAEMPNLIALETCPEHHQHYSPKGNKWLLQGREVEGLWRGGCGECSVERAGPPLSIGASSLLRVS